jgi:predicted Zn-ribbon and HTH transcriptional regulator
MRSLLRFKDHMQTIRRQIISMLSKGAYGARDLSQMLKIREKEVYEHLPHINRTVLSRGKRLHVRPAQCLSCGYVFKERSRFTRPGRCARCKSERVTEPAFQVM